MTRTLSVEAMKMTTAVTELEFCFASAAALSLNLAPCLVVDACQSKRRDDREYHGFYWRSRGSRDRIQRVGESIKDGLSVEQVDLDSGKVVALFPSLRKACEATGVSRCSVRRVLSRNGQRIFLEMERFRRLA